MSIGLILVILVVLFLVYKVLTGLLNIVRGLIATIVFGLLLVGFLLVIGVFGI